MLLYHHCVATTVILLIVCTLYNGRGHNYSQKDGWMHRISISLYHSTWIHFASISRKKLSLIIVFKLWTFIPVTLNVLLISFTDTDTSERTVRTLKQGEVTVKLIVGQLIKQKVCGILVKSLKFNRAWTSSYILETIIPNAGLCRNISLTKSRFCLSVYTVC